MVRIVQQQYKSKIVVEGESMKGVRTWSWLLLVWLIAGCSIKHIRGERVQIFESIWRILDVHDVGPEYSFPGLQTPLVTTGKFILVQLEINNPTRETTSLPIMDFRLVDSRDRSVAPTKIDLLSGALGALNPGTRLQFVMLFDVAQDTRGYRLELRVEQSDRHDVREEHQFILGL